MLRHHDVDDDDEVDDDDDDDTIVVHQADDAPDFKTCFDMTVMAMKNFVTIGKRSEVMSSAR